MRSAPSSAFLADLDRTVYTVRFASTAKRDLQKLPPRVLSAVIEFAFGDLAREPKRVGKPLRRELVGMFSARRGPYRLLYRVDDDESMVWVQRVDHRADVDRRP